MAVSLSPIRVSCITPGWILVRNERKKNEHMPWDENTTPLMHSQHPAGRAGKAEDILEGVLFCYNCKFYTGETLMIDGGMSKRLLYEDFGTPK